MLSSFLPHVVAEEVLKRCFILEGSKLKLQRFIPKEPLEVKGSLMLNVIKLVSFFKILADTINLACEQAIPGATRVVGKNECSLIV